MKELSNLQKAIISSKIRRAVDDKKTAIEYVKYISGGMSNSNHLFRMGDKSFVVHLSDKESEMFVDRAIEEKAYLTLKNNEIVQKEVYMKRSDKKCRIFEYIAGDCLTKINYQDYYSLISEAFKALHNFKPLLINDYEPFQRLANLKEKALVYTELQQDFYSIYDKILTNKEEILNRPLCPCHNDVQPSNLILYKDKVYIIDFEFAGNNDYLYDIASFGNLDFNDSMELLKVYNRDYTTEDLRLLKVYRTIIDIQWYLVATIKDEIGTGKKLGLDFKKIANYFLNNAKDRVKEI